MSSASTTEGEGVRYSLVFRYIAGIILLRKLRTVGQVGRKYECPRH